MKSKPSNQAERLYKALGPDDQDRIDRAVAAFEDDATREANKDDLGLVENGHKVWSFRHGRGWLAFIEEPELIVVHLSILSAVRYDDTNH